MTREQAKEIYEMIETHGIEVIKAYGEGRTIQHLNLDGEWVDCDMPISFSNNHSFRIKPEENNRITSSNECEYKDYQDVFNSCKDCEKQTDKNDETEYEPFSCCSDLINFCGTKLIYVINKKYKTEMLITGFDDEGLPSCVLLFGDMWITLKELFENYTFCDGHPCGIIE